MEVLVSWGDKVWVVVAEVRRGVVYCRVLSGASGGRKEGQRGCLTVLNNKTGRGWFVLGLVMRWVGWWWEWARIMDCRFRIKLRSVW